MSNEKDEDHFKAYNAPDVAKRRAPKWARIKQAKNVKIGRNDKMAEGGDSELKQAFIGTRI